MTNNNEIDSNDWIDYDKDRKNYVRELMNSWEDNPKKNEEFNKLFKWTIEPL